MTGHPTISPGVNGRGRVRSGRVGGNRRLVVPSGQGSLCHFGALERPKYLTSDRDCP
jgi:hypothetical protein